MRETLLLRKDGEFSLLMLKVAFILCIIVFVFSPVFVLVSGRRNTRMQASPPSENQGSLSDQFSPKSEPQFESLNMVGGRREVDSSLIYKNFKVKQRHIHIPRIGVEKSKDFFNENFSSCDCQIHPLFRIWTKSSYIIYILFYGIIYIINLIYSVLLCINIIITIY